MIFAWNAVFGEEFSKRDCGFIIFVISVFSVENGEDGEDTEESALDKNKNKIVASPPISYHDDEVTDGHHGNMAESEPTEKKTKITAEHINDMPEKYITPEEKVAAILRGMYINMLRTFMKMTWSTYT